MKLRSLRVSPLDGSSSPSGLLIVDLIAMSDSGTSRKVGLGIAFMTLQHALLPG
jgi:hypothetical protein